MTPRSLARSIEPVTARHAVRARGSPVWADWNDERAEPYTLGIEEEIMLLDPDGRSLVRSSDEVLAGLSDELALHASPETHASVVELNTGVTARLAGRYPPHSDQRSGSCAAGWRTPDLRFS